MEDLISFIAQEVKSEAAEESVKEVEYFSVKRTDVKNKVISTSFLKKNALWGGWVEKEKQSEEL